MASSTPTPTITPTNTTHAEYVELKSNIMQKRELPPTQRLNEANKIKAPLHTLREANPHRVSVILKHHHVLWSHLPFCQNKSCRVFFWKLENFPVSYEAANDIPKRSVRKKAIQVAIAEGPAKFLSFTLHK
jgi:hypothetical protein